MDNSFKFRIYLPSLKKYVYFKELTNEHHMVLTKYIQNDDNERLVEFFEQLIISLCSVKLQYDKLTKVDIFCILLNLRIICIDSHLKLNFKCQKTDKRYAIDLDLYDVLNKVTNFNQKYKNTITINKDLKVTLKVPVQLMCIDSTGVILDSLDRIRIFKKTYDLKSMSKDQKLTILESLPGEVLLEVGRAIEKDHENYKVSIFTHRNPHNPEFESTDYILELYNNTFYDFIKVFFNENLLNLYYTRYVISKHLNFNINYIESVTPAETDTYITFLKKEMEEEKKKSEKGSKGKQGGTLPMPEGGFQQ